MSESIYKVRTQKYFKPILETQIIGISRVILGLPIDHVFDRFKTLLQAENTQSSIKQLFKDTYQRNGVLKGVFAGFSSQISIQLFKQYYRWPMMILIPKYYKELLPNTWIENHPALHKGLAGTTIAFFESFVTCPLERIKCQLMTQHQSKSIFRQLWKNERSLSYFVRNLYTGMEAMVLKQVVSWTNYLYWDHKIRYFFKESPSQALTLPQIAMCSLLTAIPNILLVQPFDAVKTAYQMEKNGNYKQLTIPQAFVKVYKDRGFIGYYAGWQFRLSQFIIQAALSTPVMDYLERLHGLPNEL
ncbi:unnamed protein product [Paramecium pentaurelia]|uniref:Mitochondrial carrier protein n=1 Tax=Paramecium pentaurelia TaxID=43138 RepID=A0A8S1V7H2_9CILI|nr:unnamed protein product [Paramecium pentaurelia]